MQVNPLFPILSIGNLAHIMPLAQQNFLSMFLMPLPYFFLIWITDINTERFISYKVLVL